MYVSNVGTVKSEGRYRTSVRREDYRRARTRERTTSHRVGTERHDLRDSVEGLMITPVFM